MIPTGIAYRLGSSPADWTGNKTVELREFRRLPVDLLAPYCLAAMLRASGLGQVSALCYNKFQVGR